jgi:hypothetical protein
MLDSIEESLDEITLGVECEVAGPFRLASRSWRDDSFDGAHLKAGDEAVGTITVCTENLNTGVVVMKVRPGWRVN